VLHGLTRFVTELVFVAAMCRTYGALNSIATDPSPSGLGYVLSRLWRSGFVAGDLRLCGGRFGIFQG
jgi:hypothetical protein